MLTSEAPPAPPSGTDPSRERRLHRASQLIAAVIVAGYLSVPLAVMAGLVD